MYIRDNSLMGSPANITELRTWVKAAATLLGSYTVYVKGTFKNVSSGDLAFLDYTWTEVEGIGYKYLTLSTDDDIPSEYSPCDDQFSVKIVQKEGK